MALPLHSVARLEDALLAKPVVLVVEDEPIIRMETVQMLKEAGFAVLDVPNTDDAMAILQGRCDIRAVFTELRVPGFLDGMDLGRAIAARWPRIRLIVTSGVPEADDFPAGWRYVPKPYDGAQVAVALCTMAAPRT